MSPACGVYEPETWYTRGQGCIIMLVLKILISLLNHDDVDVPRFRGKRGSPFYSDLFTFFNFNGINSEFFYNFTFHFIKTPGPHRTYF